MLILHHDDQIYQIKISSILNEQIHFQILYLYLDLVSSLDCQNFLLENLGLELFFQDFDSEIYEIHYILNLEVGDMKLDFIMFEYLFHLLKEHPHLYIV
jgi:hypothetical protein